jgi:purine-nucleoside phosphorylase
MSYEKAAAAAEFIRSRVSEPVDIAIVLGSGLGAFADEVEERVILPFEEIPGFVRSTVQGHAGRLVIGGVEGRTVAIQQGRFHYYEGHDMEQVMLPVRAFGLLGVRNLILTNAAGSMNSDLQPGSLMLISDHLNCFGVNPLRGPNDERFGPRFPDMTQVYDRELQRIAEEAGHEISLERYESGIDGEQMTLLTRGIYCGLSGPTYETPAEVRMYREMGGDVVGMSTVPEAVAARHMGIKVLGISCITNLAAGMSDEPINHEEVMETGARVAEVFKQLLRRIVSKISP